MKHVYNIEIMSQLLRLQRLQNCAVRLVFSLNKSDHVSDYYRELHWLKVTQLIQFHLACVMFHQYHAAKGIMFVPPIQFGSRTSYNTRTQPYFANSNRIRLGIVYVCIVMLLCMCLCMPLSLQ